MQVNGCPVVQQAHQAPGQPYGPWPIYGGHVGRLERGGWGRPALRLEPLTYNELADDYVRVLVADMLVNCGCSPIEEGPRMPR